MSNIFQNKDLIFKYNRNRDGSIVPPKIFLYTRRLKKIGQIEPIYDLNIVPNLNEANTCSFTIYQKNNGIEKPIFHRIKNLSVILIEGFGFFEIRVNVTEDQAVCKKITGTSLQESELGQYDCTLEINTDSDTAREDYNGNYPTLFYRDLSMAASPQERERWEKSSLLHRLLTYAPTYTIGHVDDSLMGINREFSCSDSTVYDFLQEVAEEVGCIFLFTPNKREINAFDLEEHCLNCGGRHIIDGVCQSCGSQNTDQEKKIQPGYGLDTSIYVDTSTIVESIEDTVDVDQVKNCFKLVAGDDETTNRIGQRLIGNSNYIWTFGEEQLEEFSDELRDKWTEYQKYVEAFQPRFNELWDKYNQKSIEKDKYEYTMMPVSEYVHDDDPTAECAKIYEEIVANIPHYVIGSTNAVESTIENNVLKYANFICPQGYVVEYQKDELGRNITRTEKNYDKESKLNVITNFISRLYIYVPNCKDESGQNDKYFFKPDKDWELKVLPGYNKYAGKSSQDAPEVFTHNYYLYLKQMIDFKMAKSDTVYKPKYDTDYPDGKPNKNDAYYYEKYFNNFAIKRLTSFLDAYNTCIVILNELDSELASNKTQQSYHYIIKEDKDGTTTVSDKTMYDALTEKYTAFAKCISDIISDYTQKVEKLESEMQVLDNEIKKINEACNIKNYLGTELYHELISFKREQTYENQNFTSHVTEESLLMENIEEFILRARQEIAKACQFQHNVPISMSNLLTLTPYEQFFDVFALGNYIRTRINGELVKLRIISIPFDFENVEQCEVIFSDALVGNQVLKDMQKNTQKAQSMATSFDYVQKQSTKNDQQLSSFTQMFNEGLDATKNMIMNADNETVVFDSHGILGREMDEDAGEYTDFQYRLTSKGIAFTDDSWGSIRTALGRIRWNDNWTYGLIADTIVGKVMAGERLTIENKSGSVQITGDGITLDGGKITWTKKLPSEAVDGLDDNLSNLSEFKKKVNYALTGLSNTEIGSDYVISPKIGGGYLYIKDTRTSNGISIEINPNGTKFDGHDDNYVFNIKKYNNIILGVTNKGDGYFNGKITANSGKIGNWIISNGWLKADESAGISWDSSDKLTHFSINGDNMEMSAHIDGDTNSKGTLKFRVNTHNTSATNTTDDHCLYANLGYISLYSSGQIKLTSSDDMYLTSSNIVVSGKITISDKLQIIKDESDEWKYYLGNDLAENGRIVFQISGGYNCNLRPFQDNTSNLGTQDHKFRDIHTYTLNAQTIKIAGLCYIGENIAVTTQNNDYTRITRIVHQVDAQGNPYVHLDTGAGAYGIYYSIESDTKLKKNIKNTDVTALERIMQLDFIQYDWKQKEEHVDLGISANQLEGIIPEAVNEIVQPEDCEYESIKNINPNILVLYSLKAIKEMSEIIEIQKKEIKRMKQSISYQRN